MEVGQVIFEQIKAIDKMALWAWGSKDFYGGKLMGEQEGLKFKISNCPKAKRGSWVMILLNGSDLYDITVYRIYKGEYKVDNEANDIYAEDLVRVIDNMVG